MKLEFAKWFYPLASCLFVALLLLPLTDQFFPVFTRGGISEQRNLVPLPKFEVDSLTGFTKKFENYYDDNFGLRETLIKLGAWIKYTIFRASATPDKVMIGREDWLFLSGAFYGITQELSRKNIYGPQELKRAVQLWEKNKRELNARNIVYYKAFWPDKYYIFPEMLPFGMREMEVDWPHRCDQAEIYLKETHSPVHYIDVRKDLEEAKKTTKIYYKYDSHWNRYGAFIAYRRLMNTLSADLPLLEPYSACDFKIDWVLKEGRGDLATIINMQWHELEPTFTLKKHLPCTKQIPAEDFPEKTTIFINDSSATPLTALIYRDSYTSAMEPFLMLHFRKIVFMWDVAYSIKMVERVKPNVVIECYASRYFR